MRALPSPRLCLITDHTRSPDENVATVRSALEAGVRWVQVRDKALSGIELFRLTEALRVLTREHDATLIVNDRADVAAACEADGVHLPGNGLDPGSARLVVGADAYVGVSVHSSAEIEALAALPDTDRPDYVQFGPVFETPSKAKFGAPQGLDKLGDAARAGAGLLSITAVGGIDPGRAADVLARGADAVSVIGAIHGARSPGDAARDFLAALAALA